MTAIGDGANGVFAYGLQPRSFPPTSPRSGDNYWVDVVFNDTVNDPQANDDSGFVDHGEWYALNSGSALLANDTDPNGLPLSITGVSNPINGTVSYNSNTQTVSFVPTAGYTGPASFTYTITDGQATASGNVSTHGQLPD